MNRYDAAREVERTRRCLPKSRVHLFAVTHTTCECGQLVDFLKEPAQKNEIFYQMKPRKVPAALCGEKS